MQDVKIIDIDNIQWNIKDQEARNQIATLEESKDITNSVNVLIGKASVIRSGKVIQVTGTIEKGQDGNTVVISNLPKAKINNNMYYGVIVYSNGVVSYARYENQNIIVNVNTVYGGAYTVTYIAE